MQNFELEMVERWISANCKIEPGVVSESSALYDDFALWIKPFRYSLLSHNKFSRALRILGCELVAGTNGRRMIRGIQLC